MLDAVNPVDDVLHIDALLPADQDDRQVPVGDQPAQVVAADA